LTEKSGPSLPTTVEKREYLYGKGASKDALIKLGDRYQEAGRLEDAALFFHRAEDTGRLEKLSREAVASGDYFAYVHVARLMASPPKREDLQELAARAREAGLEVFARQAEEAAGEKDSGPEE